MGCNDSFYFNPFMRPSPSAWPITWSLYRKEVSQQMEMSQIILFDLGGVLVDFVGFTQMIQWMPYPISLQEFADRWLLSPAASRFEQGRSKPAEFARSLIDEFHFNMDSNQFIDEFRNFIKRLYPGVPELLSGLSRDFLIASFSNTNELHWPKLCRETGIDRLLRRNFLSYQTGYVKPHPEAYRNVIDTLQCRPEQVLYFDDNQMNVDMGNRMGMQSFKVQGIDELRRQLNTLGIAADTAVGQ